MDVLILFIALYECIIQNYNHLGTEMGVGDIEDDEDALAAEYQLLRDRMMKNIQNVQNAVPVRTKVRAPLKPAPDPIALRRISEIDEDNNEVFLIYELRKDCVSTKHLPP